MNQEALNGLKLKLENNHQFPGTYTFKFILPSDNKRIATLSSYFSAEADIRFKDSSKGNYTSLTIREKMESAQAVIDMYQEASQIEGIISL